MSRPCRHASVHFEHRHRHVRIAHHRIQHLSCAGTHACTHGDGEARLQGLCIAHVACLEGDCLEHGARDVLVRGRVRQADQQTAITRAQAAAA